jgi:hypothetical protein
MENPTPHPLENKLLCDLCPSLLISNPNSNPAFRLGVFQFLSIPSLKSNLSSTPHNHHFLPLLPMPASSRRRVAPPREEEEFEEGVKEEVDVCDAVVELLL